MKNKRLLWLGLFICSLIITVLWIMVIKVHSDYVNTPPNNLIGNKPPVVAELQENGFPFSFLVIGDSRAKKTSERLIKLGVAKGTPAFMVMNGDFVWRPGIWSHRFFLSQMLRKVKPSFPVFLVPGNHEIFAYDTSRIKDPEQQVIHSVYESLYGPRNLDFVYNNCLFILCDGDGQSPENYLDYLRDVLSKKAADKKYIFIFTHYPPRGLDQSIKKACLPNELEFFALMEQYKVNYCFFGHHHGYWKGARNGATYIISGGGGARLEPHIPDKLHHILRITVGPDKIEDEKITSPAQSNLGNWFRETAFTVIFPSINQGWVFYGILVALLFIAGYLLFKFIKASAMKSE